MWKLVFVGTGTLSALKRQNTEDWQTAGQGRAGIVQGTWRWGNPAAREALRESSPGRQRCCRPPACGWQGDSEKCSWQLQLPGLPIVVQAGGVSGWFFLFLPSWKLSNFLGISQTLYTLWLSTGLPCPMHLSSQSMAAPGPHSTNALPLPFPPSVSSHLRKIRNCETTWVLKRLNVEDNHFELHSIFFISSLKSDRTRSSVLCLWFIIFIFLTIFLTACL